MKATSLAKVEWLEGDDELRNLIETIPAMAWAADRNGANVFASRRWTEYTGLSARATMGWGWRSALHPGDEAGFVEKWHRSLASGEAFEGEARLRRASDGEYRWFLVRAEPLRDAHGIAAKWYGIATDIEERKRAEQALRASEQRFRALVEFSFDVYWETDENHRFTRQDFARALADAPPAELELGKTRWEIPYLEPGEDAWRAHRAMLDAHLPFRDFELVRALPSGGKKYVSVSGMPRFDDDGRFIGYRGVGRHVTQRKQEEQERVRLESRLRQAETMEGIGRFASGIAHDFNNSLTAILWYGEMIREDAPRGSERERYASNVLAASLRARELVRDLLAYARGGTTRRAPFDVRGAVGEAMELARNCAPPGLELSCRIPGEPVVVMGDATQLHRIVTNLCTNAVHAIDEPGRVDVSLERLDFDAPRTLSHGTLGPGAYAAIRVEDSGHGMDEATAARIFEPFFTTKEPGKGTGLGLALVHCIVSQLGGAIDVKTGPGAGSRFSIYLPLHAAA